MEEKYGVEKKQQ